MLSTALGLLRHRSITVPVFYGAGLTDGAGAGVALPVDVAEPVVVVDVVDALADVDDESLPEEPPSE